MDNENKPKAGQVVKRLIAEDGWKGLYRGLGPRFFSSSAWGTSMIVCYEYLSMFSPPLVKCILMLLVPWLLYQTIVTCIYMVAYFTAAHASWVYMHNNSYLEFSLYGWIIQVNWHLQSISLVSCTISFMSNENLD